MCYANTSFWKQLYILTATLMTSISVGVTISFSGALKPALLAANGTDIKATKEQMSSMGGVIGIIGIPGFIFLPIIMQVLGRKIVLVVINLLQLLGWIIIVFATNITSLFTALTIQGFAIGCPIVTSMIISEYCSPKRRGYFMVMKKLVVSLGVLFCHILSLFWSWRQIAAFCLLFNFFGILLTLFCPESPAFLALKGDYEACEQAYVWLNGKDCDKKELLQLIAVQKDQKEKKYRKTRSYKSKVNGFIKRFQEKDFQRAVVIVILVSIVIESYGRHFFMAYIVQMMDELFSDKSYALYFSIGNDCLTILALAIAGVIITLFQRRMLLFVSGIISILIMFGISALVIFKSDIGLTGAWMALLILFYSFFTSMTVTPVVFSYFGEIFPLEHRGVGASITGIAFSCSTAISLGISPIILEHTGLVGIFLTFGAAAFISLGILFFKLPETKDKTLQEIEFEIKGIERPSIENEPLKL